MGGLAVILCLWLVSGACTAMIAVIKGRSPALWFILGAVAGAVTIPLLLLLGNMPGGGNLRA
ncbi:MAG: hypothetical protein PVF65_03060 [Sphingomonadales bacterium]|jgi:hypothetical protein